MSSSDKQRGVFPGLEFFTTLGDIAKEATQKIKDIDRELGQSTTTQDLEDGTLWTELHLEFNKAYNQSIGLKQSLINKQSICDSLEAFNSMINWIKIETNRVEKQLQQFGYKTDENNNDYEYQLPLTPQQQIIYDQQQQHIKDNNNKQSNSDQMEIDNQENENHEILQSKHDDNDQKNQSVEDIDNDDNDIDIDIDINSKQNQESDIKSSSNSNSDSHSPQQNKESNANLNNKNKESSDTLSLDQQEITTTNLMRKPHHQTILPPSPAMPVLDDKFKFFFS